ncbi:pyridoxal phosphate-dependent aminotransferase [Pedobacter sp. AW31-3R]|uniref:pyridoxal phosphate-dependent aminotransferase n=1 Tax=Pedobacter sp. AW31-3R TaxID=3445781 RepID=UPI003FA0A6C8
MLSGHGDDGYTHPKEITADFSTNVWYGGAPAGLKDYLFDRWNRVCKYPEVIGESLRHKIAAHHGFEEGNILVANGSTESIYLIAQAFKFKRTTIVVPAFAEYEDACRLHDHEISFLPWDQFSVGAKLDTDVVFICNPNNPTGAVFEQVEKMLLRYPMVIFVIDEAFIEFTFAIPSVVRLITIYDNLIVMRSMTKAYAIPGLRLGYIAASVPLIARLQGLKLPWTVNVMALEAGHYIFDHMQDFNLPLQQLLNDKKDLVRGLSTTSLKVQYSHTHFFIAETRVHNAAALKAFLLREFDILIRNADNFRGLNDRAVRIATLNSEKNNLLLEALSSWD